VARVLSQIPEPRKHLVRYYGRYSNVSRGKRRKARQQAEGTSEGPVGTAAVVEPSNARRRWAELLRRVYEVDPLVCPKCGGQMKVIGFITQRATIRRILDHLRAKPQARRGPPVSRAPTLATV
jgi:hypothetical protein